MRYGLIFMPRARSHFLKLSKNEFDRTIGALNYCLESLYMEEKLDVVLDNYIEFKNSLLSISTEYSVRHLDGGYSMEGTTNTVNRRIINLLASCKMYVDQTARHIRNMYEGESDLYLKIKRLFSNKYDKLLSYRFMESLRNYSQHRHFPSTSIRFNIKKDKKNMEGLLYFSVTPFVETEEIRRDSKFKRSVIKEIAEQGEDIDLTDYISDYVGALGCVQEEIRSIISSDFETQTNILADAIQRFRDECDDIVGEQGLFVVAEKDDKTLLHEEFLSMHAADMTKRLMHKNCSFSGLASRVVTSQEVHFESCPTAP